MRWVRTHRGTKASIYFENSQLVKGGRVLRLREGVVSHDLVIARRFDVIPVPGWKVSMLDG
jgi:hypothetical protein